MTSPSTRRDFLSSSLSVAGGLLLYGSRALSSERRRHTAMFQETDKQGRITCTLCPHGCLIPEGKRGICGVRENEEGSLNSLVYGYPCSIHIDPVEKKPFFHVLPGTSALSVSTVGCNMTCRFCQNWQISRSRPEDVSTSYVDPETIASRAIDHDASSIAYTYGEPAVFYEYMSDIATEGRRRNLLNLVVTNGYYSKNAISELCTRVEAIKIDLKSFRDDYYRSICGAELAPVLDSIRTIASSGVWLEIVYLMVPTLNDSDAEIKEMSEWITGEIGTDVPVHLSRFFPQYMLVDLPPTPVSSLERARALMLDQGVKYVYIGNVPGHAAGSTFCHSCGETVIKRNGYRVGKIDVVNGSCIHCGEDIPGLWERS